MLRLVSSQVEIPRVCRPRVTFTMPEDVVDTVALLALEGHRPRAALLALLRVALDVERAAGPEAWWMVQRLALEARESTETVVGRLVRESLKQ